MEENNYTKLISVRLEKEVLQAIDEYDKSLTPMGRSYYINLALRQLFVNSSKEQIYEFLYTNQSLFE